MSFPNYSPWKCWEHFQYTEFWFKIKQTLIISMHFYQMNLDFEKIFWAISACSSQLFSNFQRILWALLVTLWDLSPYQPKCLLHPFSRPAIRYHNINQMGGKKKKTKSESIKFTSNSKKRCYYSSKWEKRNFDNNNKKNDYVCHFYRLDVPILIIKKQHWVNGNPSPWMNSLEVVCLVCPTRKDLLFNIKKNYF